MSFRGDNIPRRRSEVLETVIDPADGRPALKVKASYSEKHRLLEKYGYATHGARRSYPGARKTCYVELHAGPGRVTLDGQVFSDGSPLRAWREAVRSNDLYSNLLIADREAAFVTACGARLEALNAPVESRVGEAIDTASWAAERMDRYGLHLVFLDPFRPRSASVRSVQAILFIEARRLHHPLQCERSTAQPRLVPREGRIHHGRVRARLARSRRGDACA